MKEVIFDRNNYKSYKDFYHDVCIKLDKDSFIDWNGQYEDLGYNADLLDEFLWYCHEDNLKCVFNNFDKEKISKQKTYDDYHYSIIIEVFEDFAKNYPNNKVEFMPVEK